MPRLATTSQNHHWVAHREFPYRYGNATDAAVELLFFILGFGILRRGYVVFGEYETTPLPSLSLVKMRLFRHGHCSTNWSGCHIRLERNVKSTYRSIECFLRDLIGCKSCNSPWVASAFMDDKNKK